MTLILYSSSMSFEEFSSYLFTVEVLVAVVKAKLRVAHDARLQPVLQTGPEEALQTQTTSSDTQCKIFKSHFLYRAKRQLLVCYCSLLGSCVKNPVIHDLCNLQTIHLRCVKPNNRLHYKRHWAPAASVRPQHSMI